MIFFQNSSLTFSLPKDTIKWSEYCTERDFPFVGALWKEATETNRHDYTQMTYTQTTDKKMYFCSEHAERNFFWRRNYLDKCEAVLKFWLYLAVLILSFMANVIKFLIENPIL